MKPSFGQVLGYIQEGEPLALDLPNRKASIYTSSHFYLDDYPNAPEPVSETPLPHTTLNPAAAFETADEGYDGVPFPHRRGHQSRPGPAQRRPGPARPPTLGGRLRESGIQAAETVIAGAAAGAAAATRSVSENQTMNGAAATGWTARCAYPGARRDWRRLPTRCRPPKSLEGPAKWSPCWSGPEGGGGGAPGGAGHRTLRLAASGGGGSNGRLRFGGGGGGRGSRDGGGRGNGRSSDRPGRGHTGGGRRCETGGGTDSDASRPSRATDVQTLNGMQESGAIDHFFAQQLRRQPQVYRIDTDSESEPQAQPQQQIRARPVRRQGQGRQQPTPFGINQVPIPVSSDSDRISRQSRSDRGPLGTQGSARPFAQPSFDALRQASEPEAA